MKGRITIEVDFDNGNEPFINVYYDPTSDDVRDKLLHSFIQSLQGTSSWLQVNFPENRRTMEIRAVTPDELTSLLADVKNRINENK
jgi:hypothetical protein